MAYDRRCNMSINNIMRGMESLFQNNSVDAISMMNKHSASGNGITFELKKDGSFDVYGTSTSTYFITLFNDSLNFPCGIEKGKTYYVNYTSTKVRFDVYAYTSDAPDTMSEVLKTTSSGVFTIPSNAVGLVVRLTVLSDRVVDENVNPIIILHPKYTNDPMITIIDDDGAVGYYTDLFPLQQSKHIPIASAPIGYRIGESSNMTWEQIETCFKNGCEILSHSYSHWGESTANSKTVNELTEDYQKQKNLLSAHGIDTGDILIYPGAAGSSNNAVNAAKRVHSCAIRSSGNVVNFFGNTDKYNVKRFRLETEYAYDINAIKGIIDDLLVSGGWMVWMIHTSQNWDASALACVSDAIDYAIGKSIPIVTAHYGAKCYLPD